MVASISFVLQVELLTDTPSLTYARCIRTNTTPLKEISATILQSDIMKF
jgi:hypothetical protein